MQRMRAVSMMVCMALLAVACSGSDGGSPDIESTTPHETEANGSQGCETTDTRTTTTELLDSRELVIDGTKRSYLLTVPTDRSNERPAPLVLNHHGLTQSAGQQRILSGFDDLAQSEGIVVAYPDAGDRSWNFDDDSDLTYIEALIDDVASTTCIDLGQVYAIGMSQGGGFSTLLACHLSDRIAGVASIAVLHHHDGPSCENPATARVLTVVGTADTIYSIEEGLTQAAALQDVPGPLAAETNDWVTTNGCDRDPMTSNLGRQITRSDYSCADGAQLTVVVHQGGHIWPAPIHGLDTNRLVWDFLSNHPEA